MTQMGSIVPLERNYRKTAFQTEPREIAGYSTVTDFARLRG